MPLTVEYIRSLKEDDFTRDVLVPLFCAMGYKDVRFHGGGILEQGKDLTMWREHAVRDRTNYAAVVKATPITGEAATAMVIAQLRQAFAHAFRGVTGEDQRVHECFVITSHPMKKEAVYTLHNVINAEPFGRYVTTLDGDRIWQMVIEYLGPRATLGVLLENYRRLNEYSKFHVDVALTTAGTRLAFKQKRVIRQLSGLNGAMEMRGKPPVQPPPFPHSHSLRCC